MLRGPIMWNYFVFLLLFSEDLWKVGVNELFSLNISVYLSILLKYLLLKIFPSISIIGEAYDFQIFNFHVMTNVAEN